MGSMKKSGVGVIVLSVAVVALAGAWWFASYNTPMRAFNDMLSTNLATPSVTRVVQQGNDQLKVAQYTQLQMGAQPVAHALTIFSQNGGVIATEEISNRTSDFVRYQKIVATAKSAEGKAIDTSSVVGKWAKLEANSSLGTTVTSGLFDQTLVGVVPIANLSVDRREALLKFMDDNDVFSYDPAKVQTVTVDGRKAYSYAVSISPAPYVKMMQNFSKLVGVHSYDDLNANDYIGAAKVSVTMAVDARSHTLTQLTQTSAGRTESYRAFGLMANSPLPTATLTTQQLTDLLGKLQ